jgi:hypothetical protein
MNDNTDLPESIASSTFHLFGVAVHCHVLSTGERVIEGSSMFDLMHAMESGADAGDVDAFVRWQRGIGGAS